MVELAPAAAAARRRPSPAAILAVVGFSVFVAADDLTVVATMLRPIIGDLGLVLPDGLDDAAWIVNAYLIAFVAVMPIAGRISDVIGRRRTFVGAYLLFMLGSIVIPLSTDFDARRSGGSCSAASSPPSAAARWCPSRWPSSATCIPEGRRARALGTLGAIETMGWVWGPLYGAMLVRLLSWQWQFWLNIPLAIVGLVAVVVGAGRPRPAAARRADRLDRRDPADGHAREPQHGAARLGRDPERQRAAGADRRRHRPALAVPAWRSSPARCSCSSSATAPTR